MSKRTEFENIDPDVLSHVVRNCTTKREVLQELSLPDNGIFRKILNTHLDCYNISLKQKELKHPIIEKECPVCGNLFSTISNGKEERTTCSHSCSNTYFRTGKNNPNYKGTQYRTVCFSYHEKKCVVCGEDKIVTVHHLDENNKNNDPSNLIPLCPTHHQYWHSRYRHLVEKTIYQYINNWKKSSIS